MRSPLLADLQQRTAALVGEGLFKTERVIGSTQSAHIELADGSSVINLCANNYLGLADNRDIVDAAHAALDRHGYGMASVRFICGTQTVHKDLEARLSAFLGTDDTILYSSCFDANGGLFETILDEDDAVISDALNHASIIDGIRLCRARRLRYDNNDMAQLEQRLQESSDARYRLVATDGVFSMDGVLANLPAICDLADAVRRIGDGRRLARRRDRRRTRARHARVRRCDGACRHHHRNTRQGPGRSLRWLHGGPSRGHRLVASTVTAIPVLQQPCPSHRSATIRVLDMLEAGDELRRRVERNAERFRAGLQQAGFTLAGAGHPIIPVMLGDARVASEMAERLLDEGIYVIAFSFPVVPQGKARIRTQMSAAHSDADIDQAIAAFVRVGQAMELVS